jgi:hypothetical protein
MIDLYQRCFLLEYFFVFCVTHKQARRVEGSRNHPMHLAAILDDGILLPLRAYHMGVYGHAKIVWAETQD